MAATNDGGRNVDRIRLKRTVLTRFESRIGNGTTFLYDAETAQLRTTDRVGYEVARRLRRPCTLDELICELSDKVDGKLVRLFVKRLVSAGFVVEFIDSGC